jgi:hypothetical protein
MLSMHFSKLYVKHVSTLATPEPIFLYLFINKIIEPLFLKLSFFLPTYCKENPIYVFLFWELRGLSPNFHIHVPVSDLYIPRIGHISLQQNRQTDPGNI